MSRPVALRPAARDDLAAIWEYGTSRWGRAQAEAYLAGLGDVLDLLAMHPEIAREHADLTPAVRMHPYRANLIIFRADDLLDVIRIPAMRMNWRGVLQD